MNEIHIIQPYIDPQSGMWVFNDQRHAFYKEPFVAGADAMLDVLTTLESIGNAELGFVLMFSEGRFPPGDSDLYVLKKSGSEFGGTWYRTRIMGRRMHGWLCPGLLRYFPTPPDEIFVAAYEQSIFSPGPAQPGQRSVSAGEKK
ncbi:MAG: DUF6717 family protein [Planctomycetota bacterium]|jgi:hypothetical protein